MDELTEIRQQLARIADSLEAIATHYQFINERYRQTAEAHDCIMEDIRRDSTWTPEEIKIFTGINAEPLTFNTDSPE